MLRSEIAPRQLPQTIRVVYAMRQNFHLRRKLNAHFTKRTGLARIHRIKSTEFIPPVRERACTPGQASRADHLLLPPSTGGPARQSAARTPGARIASQCSDHVL